MKTRINRDGDRHRDEKKQNTKPKHEPETRYTKNRKLLLVNSSTASLRPHLDKVLQAVEDQNLDFLVLGGHENRLERAQEQPLEVEVPQLLLAYKLQSQLLQGVNGILRDLRKQFLQTNKSNGS